MQGGFSLLESKVDMNLGKFGVLLEGVLRKDEDGFFIDHESGREFRIYDILSDKEDRDIRLTIASLDELDKMAESLKRKMQDAPEQKEQSQLYLPFQED